MAHSAKTAFHVGDHVSWNSEAGRVKVTAATKLKGYVIESDKSDHVAVTKGRRCESDVVKILEVPRTAL